MQLSRFVFSISRRHYGRIREELSPILDLKSILADEPYHIANCANRRSSASMPRLTALYSNYRHLSSDLHKRRHLRKQLAAEFVKAAEMGEALQSVEDAQLVKEQIGVLEGQLSEIESQMREEMTMLPNRTHPMAPIGGTEQNEVTGTFGPAISEMPSIMDHVELGKRLNIVDFEAGARTSGSSFYFLKGQGALLENALIQYALTIAIKHGFTPILPPDIVNSKFIAACGFLPRTDGARSKARELPVYTAEIDGDQESDSPLKVLAATGEIPLAAYYSGEMLAEKELPCKWVAVSHCFRPETGHHGVESRGLYRVHQFTKVELFVIKDADPATSDSTLQDIVAIQREILDGLGLHCRILNMATAELGASAYQKYDIEGYFPGRLGWGELTSASNCTDYQSRRLGLRYRTDGGVKFAHTLNGTACAVPRIIQAILENHQQLDGTVKLPKDRHTMEANYLEVVNQEGGSVDIEETAESSDLTPPQYSYETTLPLPIDLLSLIPYIALPLALTLLVLEHRCDLVRFHAWQAFLLHFTLLVGQFVASFWWPVWWATLAGILVGLYLGVLAYQMAPALQVLYLPVFGAIAAEWVRSE
ncbi:hypothetical protein PSACC_02782 [Paramicrosporidium saccamoebae]|uniref:serine--tRNA ligase n=1 Tax=Paramicrosporidium saccamoebae TaxID=1246581 RepID=A0A2H9TI28_9FUNG|nr:hypothetical protein PSACC_02782 [Paramicrosporidium saccamoebae]